MPLNLNLNDISIGMALAVLIIATTSYVIPILA
jgi:hypothetical protein